MSEKLVIQVQAGDSDVSLVIPYRGDEACFGYRERNFSHVLAWWQSYYPEAEIIVADNGGPDFDRSGSRNLGAEEASNSILIFGDADTIPLSTFPVDSALRLVRCGAWPWSIPYTRYYNADQSTSKLIRSNPPMMWDEKKLTYDHLLETSVSGVTVVPREGWEVAGGYDARFSNWGWEDNSFQLALDALWGKHRRVEGCVIHLWHPVLPQTTFDRVDANVSQRLYLKYKKAAGDPVRMAKVVGL